MGKGKGSVCFVNPDSLYVTPYFSQYRGCVQPGFDVIYWDRGGSMDEGIEGAGNVYRFSSNARSKSKLGFLAQLLKGYLGFRRFAKGLLESQDYDRVVLLTGNSAAILFDVLTKRYAGRYIVDVRDYFLENNPLYQHIEQRAIQGSGMLVVSSPAYKAFLKTDDFLVMHNDSMPELGLHDGMGGWVEGCGRPLVLASIGTAKNLAVDQQVIDYFLNDQRFELRFMGRGYEALEVYVEQRGATNVKVRGAFPASETLDLYRDVDVVLNLYGNHHPHFDYALSNKLYLAARMGKPIMVSPDTAMEDYAKRYALGMALTLSSEDEKERLLDLFGAEESARREQGAREFIELVERQNHETLDAITSFLKDSRS